MSKSAVLELCWGHQYLVQCFDKHGNLIWEDISHNLVTTVGKNDLLDKYYAGSAYTAANYIGLTASAPTFAAADTMASHAGWTEFTSFSAPTTRPAPSWSAASAGSKTVSAASSYTINATGTVGGLFLTTVNTIGGTTGVLIGGAAFTGGDQPVVNTNTLNVTPTATV